MILKNFETLVTSLMYTSSQNLTSTRTNRNRM